MRVDTDIDIAGDCSTDSTDQIDEIVWFIAAHRQLQGSIAVPALLRCKFGPVLEGYGILTLRISEALPRIGSQRHRRRRLETDIEQLAPQLMEGLAEHL